MKVYLKNTQLIPYINQEESQDKVQLYFWALCTASAQECNLHRPSSGIITRTDTAYGEILAINHCHDKIRSILLAEAYHVMRKLLIKNTLFPLKTVLVIQLKVCGLSW